jgi:hypothetical protein
MTTLKKLDTGTLTKVAIGNALNPGLIQFYVLPKSTEHSDLKGRRFDYLHQRLVSAMDRYSYEDISTFLAATIPDVNQYPFTQTMDFGNHLRNAIFDISNFVSIPMFFQADGTWVPVEKMVGAAHTRPMHVSMFEIDVMFLTQKYAPVGTDFPTHLGVFSSKFKLELPQHTVPVPTVHGVVDDDSVAASVHSAPPVRNMSFPDTPHRGLRASRTNGWTSTFRSGWTMQPPEEPIAQNPSPPTAGQDLPVLMITTFTSDHEVWKTQSAFDASTPGRTLASSSKDMVLLEHDTFLKACQFHCLIQLLRQDYVGGSTDKTSDIDSVVDILDRMVMNDNPNPYVPFADRVTTLFNDFMTVVDLLPPEANEWGLNLVQLFFFKLLKEIRDEMRDKPDLAMNYKVPTFSLLTTKAEQVGALRSLRSAAVSASVALDKRATELQKQASAFFKREHFVTTPSKKALTSTTIAIDGKKAVAFTTPPMLDTPDTSHSQHHSTKLFVSPAETTIQQNQPRGPNRGPGITIPLTYGVRDGETRPMNPFNGYVSLHPEGFRGCYACGATDHFKSSDCALDTRTDATVRTRFFNELYAHKPHLRPKETTIQTGSNAVAASAVPPPGFKLPMPSVSSFATQPNPAPSWTYSRPTDPRVWMYPPLPSPPQLMLQDPQHQFQQQQPPAFPQFLPPPPNIPGWQNPVSSQLSNSSQQYPQLQPTTPGLPVPGGNTLFTTPPPPPPPPTPPDPIKRPRYFVQKVQVRSHKVSEHSSTLFQLPAMPINIDNGFPNLVLHLGTKDSGCNVELQGLLDTCGSLNTGYLPFHAYLAHRHPEIVVSFRFHNGANPFESVRLMGAVPDPQGFDTALNKDHGVLTAVVCYRTPYVTASTGEPITISFALGNSVTTNTIFGLPMISAFGFLVDAVQLSAYSKTVNANFPLIKADARLGLPDGISFDFDEFQRMHAADSSTATSVVRSSVPLLHASNSVDDSIDTATFGIDDMSYGYLRRTVSSFSQSSDAH